MDRWERGVEGAFHGKQGGITCESAREPQGTDFNPTADFLAASRVDNLCRDSSGAVLASAAAAVQ